jgi:hypothetical protein
LKDIPSLSSLISGEPDTSYFYSDSTRRYLAVFAINKYVRYLIEYYPYFIFLNNKSEMQTADILLLNANSQTAQELRAMVTEMLVSALRLVNTAIAQQEILDSSVTLPAIEESLLSWKWAANSWCAHPNLSTPTWQQDQAKGRSDARRQLIADNEKTLQLLARRRALLENWVRVLALEALRDPKVFNDGVKVSFAQIWTSATPADELGSMIDSRILNESARRSPSLDGHCSALLSVVFFPFRWERPITAIPAYGVLSVPYDGDNLDVGQGVELPNSVDVNSEALNLEQHGPETYLLLSLRRQILAALTQIHGFDSLSGQQRKLAAYLIIGTAR